VSVGTGSRAGGPAGLKDTEGRLQAASCNLAALASRDRDSSVVKEMIPEEAFPGRTRREQNHRWFRPKSRGRQPPELAVPRERRHAIRTKLAGAHDSGCRRLRRESVGGPTKKRIRTGEGRAIARFGYVRNRHL